MKLKVYLLETRPQFLTLPVALSFLGTCIAIGSWAAVILLLISVAFYHFRIRGEERACLARYGESYQEFLDRVPRYLLFF